MKQKGFAPILILIIIAVLGVGFYLLKQNKFSPVPNSTTDWKIHTNNEYSIKYPSTCRLTWYESNSNISLDCGSGTYITLDLENTIEVKFPIEKWIAGQSYYSLDENKKVSVGGEIVSIIHNNSEWGIGTTYIVKHNDKIYEFGINPGWDEEPGRANSEKLIDQILSTFKFTD